MLFIDFLPFAPSFRFCSFSGFSHYGVLMLSACHFSSLRISVRSWRFSIGVGVRGGIFSGSFLREKKLLEWEALLLTQ